MPQGLILTCTTTSLPAFTADSCAGCGKGRTCFLASFSRGFSRSCSVSCTSAFVTRIRLQPAHSHGHPNTTTCAHRTHACIHHAHLAAADKPPQAPSQQNLCQRQACSHGHPGQRPPTAAGKQLTHDFLPRRVDVQNAPPGLVDVHQRHAVVDTVSSPLELHTPKASRGSSWGRCCTHTYTHQK